MSEALRWWVVLLVMGGVTTPLCLGALARLPDRGYTLAKPFGLLLTGYAFWLLNSMGLLPNERGGIIAALLLLALISGAFAWSRRDDMRGWFRDNWSYIATIELGFLFVFLLAVWLRSFVGTIEFTEQPMDLMFVNAASQADQFPPVDPWLSGEHVAYYYFGYLLVAMTGKFAGVATDVSYNLGFAMTGALAVVAGFGIVYNLVKMREDALEPIEERELEPAAEPQPAQPRRKALAAAAADESGHVSAAAPALASVNWKPYVYGFAAALMLVVMGNMVWLFKYASMFGIGGDGFYDWVDVSGLTADEQRKTWAGIPYPSEFFGFFDASRVYPLNDQDFRVITEFPMFSFVLGDLHPHVMALPFVLLAVALALSLYRSEEPLDGVFLLRRPLLLAILALSIGGLAFLNTWDIATLAFVMVAAVAVSNFRREGRPSMELLVQTLTFAIVVLVPAILAYIPFYTGFTSQADGILPVVTRPGITHPGTRPFHALLFWGPMFAVVLPFVGAVLLSARDRITRRDAGIAAALPAAIVVFWAVWFVFMKAAGNDDISGSGNLFAQIGDRGVGWLTAIFFGASLAAALLALWLSLTDGAGAEGREPAVFALVLASTAFLLILGTEFYYVSDLFNSRMNTVFKLYYQAWLLLALAGGFALYHLAGRWRFSFEGATRYRRAWAGLAVFALACAALYPVGATLNRTEAFEKQGQLDGLHAFSVGEREAFEWLRGVDEGQQSVIAEAVGGDYWVNGQFSRVSMATGVPAVLGWGGHEDQWRDGPAARAGRFEDVTALYESGDAAAVRSIVEKYGITYIWVGQVERNTYGDQVNTRFSEFPVAFQWDPNPGDSVPPDVIVYQAQGPQGQAEAAQ